MNDFNLNDSRPGPGRLADYLAELLERFRHFSGDSKPGRGTASLLARIRISARLLTILDPGSNPGGKGFVRLGGVLTEWVACFESCPESIPSHLGPPFLRLADYMEEILIRRDRGEPTSELDRDARWEAVLASFRHAGTPLAPLEDMEDILVLWQRRWSEESLTPVQEQQLQRRWLGLRKKGDVLFGAEGGRPEPEYAADGAAQGPQTVLLLVDSTFRRDQIRDKLRDYDYRVEIPCDPAQALESLAAGPVPRVILCDNLEPTRHLIRLRDGLSPDLRQGNIPLVLVVGGSSSGAADRERARSLGAGAAWGEPFDPVDLGRILQRLSHP